MSVSESTRTDTDAENTEGEGPRMTDDTHSQDTDHTESLMDLLSQYEGRVSETRAETYTARFTGFVFLFGILVAVALVTFNPVAITTSGVLLAFLVASAVQSPPRPGEHVSVSYDVDPKRPRPSDTVDVTVTIENTGDRTLTDIRAVDTIPEDLRVTDGSPRAGATLRAGQHITLSYSVTARRGSYAFGPVSIRARSHTGSMWVQEDVYPAVGHGGGFRCAVKADDIPLDDEAAYYIGELVSDNDGDGVEFYSTREYHRGDPPSRVNWRELAKRNELSTITFRENQSAEITLLIDARDWTVVNAVPGRPSGASLGAYAAYQVASVLNQSGHRLTVAVPGLAPRDSRKSNQSIPFRLYEPEHESKQQHKVFSVLEEIDALTDSVTEQASRPPAGRSQARTRARNSEENTVTPLRSLGTGSFRTQADDDKPFSISPFEISTGEVAHNLSTIASDATQYIFFTPLLDGSVQTLAAQLQALGFPVIVISPDITIGRGDGEHDAGDVPLSVVQVQRQTRVESLRQRGITVIDWNPKTALSESIQKQTPKGV